MFTVVSNHAEHQLFYQQLMFEGLKTHGIKAISVFDPDQVNSNHVACWGWKLGKQLQERGHNVLVMERGYIGNRFLYTSLGWNGLNGRAEFPDYPSDGGKRFFEIANLSPWRLSGKNILIMGQVPGDQSLAGKDLIPWYEKIAKEASQYYGKPVLFRPHPDIRNNLNLTYPQGIEISHRTLIQDLSDTQIAITYNSNSAVDAVLSGIPTITFDQGAMAWPVTGHSIENVLMLDREAWAFQLAWKQWSEYEIRSGFALSRLIKMMP